MRRGAHNGQEVTDQQNALLRGRIPLVALIQTLSVAEYLNFRHAAHALSVSRSSVSTRIKTLEEDLGGVLFERRHRGVRLTDAGRSFGSCGWDWSSRSCDQDRRSGSKRRGWPPVDWALVFDRAGVSGRSASSLSGRTSGNRTRCFRGTFRRDHTSGPRSQARNCLRGWGRRSARRPLAAAMDGSLDARAG